jgi:hypothetical protein
MRHSVHHWTAADRAETVFQRAVRHDSGQHIKARKNLYRLSIELHRALTKRERPTLCHAECPFACDGAIDRFLYKSDQAPEEFPMKTIRHTVNVPGQMEQLLNERIPDFRSLSSYFVALCFTDLLYLPKRPIAKAFANASWQQQRRAIENMINLRKHGWKGVNMQLHLDAVTQVEKVAVKCLKRGAWVLDHIQEELAFMRGADLRR